jgi:uncharacterized heparinase superfamily protein
MSLGRYYHTLRHLRPVQFYGRITHRLHRPRPDPRPAPAIRAKACDWRLAPMRPASMSGPQQFTFLNVTRDLAAAAAWNDPATDKLWLYNLHYFDDLDAAGCERRESWHRALISRWIAENTPGHGNGWEPYPLSLRIVNWCRWALAGHALSADAVQSLAVQARFLSQRLEYHLLGNHLWANGKALVFAGAFFAGDEPSGWLAEGLGILREQLAEQVLSDGGHFERSPMYHSIFFEDLLDLVALSHCQPGLIDAATVDGWKRSASAMLGWLDAMTHPDGDISFFNDAALGIALRPEVLRLLAHTLEIEPGRVPHSGLVKLEPSGFARMAAGDFVVIADVGPIGPDYIPGHAHADTLSFELSWRGRRVLTNSGTSCYGTGPQRQRERATAAHNTVMIDDQDSSEVWHGFRVARRARPINLASAEHAGRLVVTCEHDGYTRLAGRPVPRRSWRLDAGGLEVGDEVRGEGSHRATGFMHVQPNIVVERHGERDFELAVPDAGRLRLTVTAPATVELREGHFGREFGRLVPRPVIAWHRSGPLPFVTSVTLKPVA